MPESPRPGTPGPVEVEEHLADVLSLVRRLTTEQVELRSAAGRVVAADVVAHQDIPAFENSAMDGFAVRFDDVRHASDTSPVVLDVVGDLPAGSAEDPAITAGQAVRLMTGSAVPTAADAIVPFESTGEGLTDDFATVTVVRGPGVVGQHVRRRGSDLAAGDRVLAAGTVLGPRQVAAALSAGLVEVEATRRPRLAILSTGDELVTDGSMLRRGQIPESNGPMLAQLAAQAGADVVRQGAVRDDDASLRDVIGELDGTVDLVVLTGGVSAGAYDVVKSALGADGTMWFRQVRMQPGKPQGVGRTAGGTLLLGLPGNPVSAAVSWEVFVRPALLAMSGRTDGDRRRLRLPASEDWRSPVGRRQFVPSVIDSTDPDRWTVAPASPGQSASHLVGSLALADSYAVVPADVERVVRGDLVDVIVLD